MFATFRYIERTHGPAAFRTPPFAGVTFVVSAFDVADYQARQTLTNLRPLVKP